MHNKDLSIIKRIITQLDRIQHPDSLRIAKEIYEYAAGSQTKIDIIISRLSNSEPWEYIRGTTEFLGLSFIVTPDTLIPRVETEKLVKMANTIIHSCNIDTVVDVGTGSGAIICSIKHQSNSINAIATDISPKALAIAKQNAKKLSLEIDFHQTDLIEGVNCNWETTLILANLPYIPTDTYLKLEKSVLDFEPRTALDGGKQGIDQIAKLFHQILGLAPLPYGIILEIDPENIGYLTETLAKTKPKYCIEIVKDDFNKDRFLLFSKKIAN